MQKVQNCETGDLPLHAIIMTQLGSIGNPSGYSSLTLQKCKKSTSLILQASCIESRETQGLEIITISMAYLASGSEWHWTHWCLVLEKNKKMLSVIDL